MEGEIFAMDQGQFQGKVLAQLDAQGREIGELKVDVKHLETEFVDFRLSLAGKNGSNGKHKIGLASLWVAAGGGLGYLLSALLRGLLSTPQ